MNTKDLTELLTKIIRQETKYNRFYNGKVAELQDGKALCTIDELGWDTNEKGAICNYIDKNSLTNLKVEDIVIIGFVNNNPARAFIVGLANEFVNMPAKGYNFLAKKEALYENRENTLSVIKDDLLKAVTVKKPNTTTVNIGKANEAFVKGNTLLTELEKDLVMMTSLQSILNSWVVVPGDGGGALKAALAPFLALPLANYTNILSTTIKAE